MNDRELLELAARAAGLPPPYDEHGIFSAWVGDPEHGHWWNPLEDDGDALRLAAYLRISVLPGKHSGDGCSVNADSHQVPGVTVFRESKNMAEQMRRAITMVAAEIGKSMEGK